MYYFETYNIQFLSQSIAYTNEKRTLIEKERKRKKKREFPIILLPNLSLSLSSLFCSYGNNENIHIFDHSGKHQTYEQLQLFLCFVRSFLFFFTSSAQFQSVFCYDNSRLEVYLTYVDVVDVEAVVDV